MTPTTYGKLVNGEIEAPAAEPARKIYRVERPVNMNLASRDQLESYYEYLFLTKYNYPLPSGWWNCSMMYLLNQIAIMESDMTPASLAVGRIA